MCKPGKRGSIVAALACAGALSVAGVAVAADPIVADNTLNYTPPGGPFNMDRGERPSFENNDTLNNPHNVTARGRIGGKPLFTTPNVVGPTGSTPVSGTQYLSAGSYEFFCSVHPEMEAALNVSGAGTPVARPDIEVKVLSRDIDKVANTRKARVRVEATTDSDNVTLTLKLRNLRLGSKGNVDLDAGQARTVTLKLSRRAKNKLVDKDKAKVKLTGSVPFGAGDTASKLLK